MVLLVNNARAETVQSSTQSCDLANWPERNPYSSDTGKIANSSMNNSHRYTTELRYTTRSLYPMRSRNVFVTDLSRPSSILTVIIVTANDHAQLIEWDTSSSVNG